MPLTFNKITSELFASIIDPNTAILESDTPEALLTRLYTTALESKENAIEVVTSEDGKFVRYWRNGDLLLELEIGKISVWTKILIDSALLIGISLGKEIQQEAEYLKGGPEPIKVETLS